MDRETRARLKWIDVYTETQDSGLTCRRCGISRPTLRKWLKRYQESGVEGLRSRSRKPKNSPARKVTDDVVALISSMRTEQNIGNRRIQSELLRRHNIALSRASIHKVLTHLSVMPLRRPKREKRYRRYEKAIPGERVQMDVCKIKTGWYQYTAVDDCTRYRVL